MDGDPDDHSSSQYLEYVIYTQERHLCWIKIAALLKSLLALVGVFGALFTFYGNAIQSTISIAQSVLAIWASSRPSKDGLRLCLLVSLSLCSMGALGALLHDCVGFLYMEGLLRESKFNTHHTRLVLGYLGLVLMTILADAALAIMCRRFEKFLRESSFVSGDLMEISVPLSGEEFRLDSEEMGRIYPQRGGGLHEDNA